MGKSRKPFIAVLLCVIIGVVGWVALMITGVIPVYDYSQSGPVAQDQAKAETSRGVTLTPESTVTSPTVPDNRLESLHDELIFGFKLNMTLNEVKVRYAGIQSGRALLCWDAPELPGVRQSVKTDCQGVVQLVGQPIFITLTVINDKLFSVNGRFLPESFLVIKPTFINFFGSPDGDGDCKLDDLTDEEFRDHISRGCEGLWWQKKHLWVTLNQYKGTFDIMPLPRPDASGLSGNDKSDSGESD